MLLAIQTWQDPVSDVVIFVVENPPAAIVRFADEVRCMFVAIETDLPQTRSAERTLVINGNPPRARTKADKAQCKRQNDKHRSKN